MSLGGNLGTATGSINLDASGATSGAAQANNALASLTDTVANNWWGIKNLGLAFAALPAAIAGGVGASVVAASQLQDAVTGLARTSGLAGADLDSLTNQLLDIGKIRAVPTVEIIGIAESAGALGVATEDIAGFSKTVTDLVQTTDLTAESASTGLARLAALTNTSAGGYDNLASAIFGVGVETAATETDILALAQRLAGVGAGFGLSAGQIIAWAATVRSAGVSVQEGGTQISKTFIDIQRAISGNGAALQGWANIAGKSGDEFKALFDRDANAGLTAIVEGFGQIIASGGDFVSYLDAVGVTEQRQVRSLLLMAKAQASTTNENVKATNIQQIMNKYIADTSRLQAAVEARAQTLSGQIQILKNTVFAASAAFGKDFAGALTFAIGWMTTFINGIAAIPGPVKAIVAGFVFLIAILSGFAAVALIVGSRVVIAIDAFRRLAAGGTGAAGAMQRLGVATQEVALEEQEFSIKLAATNARLADQERMALVVAQAMAFMSGSTQTGTAILAEYNATARQNAAATAEAEASNRRFGKAITFSGYAAKATTAIMIGLIVYTLALGQAQERVNKKTEEARKANGAVTTAMRDTGVSISGAANAALTQIEAYQRAANAARELGISEATLQKIIQGTSSREEFNDFFKRTHDSQGNASDSAKELLRDTDNLRESWKQSEGDADVAHGSMEGVKKATVDLGQAAQQTDAEFKKLQKTLEAQAQASVDLIDAQLSATVATLDLADAAVKLKEAQDKAAHAAEYQQQAELKLQDAQLKQEQATRNLATAQDDLANARAKAAQDVADANFALIDSQTAYADSLDKITKAEDVLAELRLGPAAKVFIDATNKLVEAQNKLHHATLDVRDLEEQIAFLRQNGAGARDLEEAELALADARASVADETQNVADAQKDLSDLSDPIKRAKAITDAERDLQKARQDSAKSLAEIKTKEADLAKARKDQANDTAYKDAQLAVIEAQLAIVDATIAVREATNDLNEILGGSLIREAAREQNAYEQQLYNTAKANVEVQKQTLLMAGETWDAGKAAHALGEELDKLVGKTDLFRQARENLAKAPNIPKDKSTGDSTFNAGDGGDGGLGGGGGDKGLGVDPELAKTTFNDVLAGLVSSGGIFLGLQFGPMIVKAMVKGLGSIVGRFKSAPEAALVGAEVDAGIAAGEVAGAPVIAAGMEGGVAAGAGIAAVAVPILIGVLIAAIVLSIAYLLLKDRNWQKVGDAIVEGLGSLKDWIINNWAEILIGALLWPFLPLIGLLKIAGIDVLGGLKDGLIEFVPEIFSWFQDTLYGGIQGALSTVLTWLVDRGKDILHGLWDGIVDEYNVVHDFFIDLPGHIQDFFTNARDWLADAGRWIIQGIWHGIQDEVGTIWDFFLGLPDKVKNFLSNAGGWLLDGAASIMSGLLKGLENGVGAVWDWLRTFVGDFLHKITHPWEIFSPSRVMKRIGGHLMEGFRLGLKGEEGAIAKQLDTINALIKDRAPQFDASALAATGLDSFAGGRAAVDFAVSGAGLKQGIQNVVNNYINETIETNVESPANPEDIVNGYTFAKRRQRRG